MATKDCLIYNNSAVPSGNRQRPLTLNGTFNNFSQTIAQATAVDLRKALDAARKTFKKNLKKSANSSPGTLSPKAPVATRAISAPVSPNNPENSVFGDPQSNTENADDRPSDEDRPLRIGRPPTKKRTKKKMNQEIPPKKKKVVDNPNIAENGERFRPSNSVSMNEVIKLHQDEGVINLLHALPASRRRVPLLSFSNCYGQASFSPSYGHRIPKSHKKPTSSFIPKAEPSSNEVDTKEAQPILMRVEEPTTLDLSKKFVKMENLTNQATMSFLKSLSTKHYVRLWSSHSKFSLSVEASQTSSSLSNICGDSSSSPSGSFNSDVSSVSNVHFRHQQRLPMLQASSRWTAVIKNYRDILVKQHDTFAQIVLNTSSTGLKNALSASVCYELIDALSHLEEEPSCSAVIFTGMGRIFCQGVDLSLLAYESSEKQRRSAESIAMAINKLLSCIIAFPKVIIAAVNGMARGLGVTILPFFDLVYASDRAEFRTEYGRLGQIPEGCPAHTMIGSHLILNELFLFSKRLTACEALNYGLVTTVIWSDKFYETILPKVAKLALSPLEGLTDVRDSMKSILRKSVTREVLNEDMRLLIQSWTRPSFPSRAKDYLQMTECIF